nr:MAG TPA: hypothetical protein [Caudoviricetes sp.]
MIVLAYLLSWGVTCGIIYLITLCFGIGFSLPIATGCWLIMLLISTLFKNKKK